MQLTHNQNIINTSDDGLNQITNDMIKEGGLTEDDKRIMRITLIPVCSHNRIFQITMVIAFVTNEFSYMVFTQWNARVFVVSNIIRICQWVTVSFAMKAKKL